MPTPSLLIVPARFKTGKLYSQIPTSGAGDFTVTRNTEARRFDSAGLVASVASGIPRLDYYTSGGTAGCPALLVEPSGTNLCLQSQDFSTTWAALSSATVNTNTAISPDGTQNADTINLSTTAATRVAQNVAIANSTTYTLSCFFKNIALTAGQTFRLTYNNQVVAPNNFEMTALIDLAAGTASYTVGGTAGTGFSGTATGRVENYGNGWYRISVTATTGTGAAANGQIQILQIPAGAARSFHAYGAQLEASSVPTSYIPTTTGTGSRSADVISVSGAVSGSIGQTEGTIYVEVDYRNFANITILSVQTASIASGAVRIENTSNGTQLRCHVRGASGETVMDQAITSPSLSTGINKIAVGYSSASSGLCIALNGTVVFTGTAAAAFTVNPDRILLGSREVSGAAQQFFNNRIRSAALYTTRLTNAQLAALTTL